jgi:nickel-dependent lactate racemase
MAVPGVLDGNPVSEDMEDIASRLDPCFLINFAVGESGGFLGVFAGHWREAHRRGCEFVEGSFRVPVRERADIVLASRGGHPMDLSFYQAFQSNANALAALEEGGVLIMVGQCSEGLGSYDFQQWFELGSVEAIEEQLRASFTVPGFVVYRAAVLARKVARLILVSDLDPELVRRIGVVPHATIRSALEEAWSVLPEGKVLCMPHASQTIPDIAGS